MNNLLNFFLKHSAWFVFVAYLVLSVVLLLRDNPYHQSVYLTSANAVSARVYEVMSTATGYLHLRDINDDLQRRNALLENEVIALRGEVADLRMLLADSVEVHVGADQFDFVMARVISNSIAQTNNYITINRGSLDGVKAEMGVVDQNGVVGVVNVVGPHAARVISLLNPDFRMSAMLRGSNYFGSLVWDGKDARYAVLEDLPKYVKYEQGDTVVSSGYSTMFPKGLIIGTVAGPTNNTGENFMSLRIRLTTNFNQLSDVRVITNFMAEELDALEADSLRKEQAKP